MIVSFDLHLHSCHSFDGLMPPRSIVQVAMRRGLSAIAVTDHNTIAGGVEAFEANQYGNLMIIVGAEIQTEVGDILGLFLTREIQSRRSSDVVDEIHAQGGLAVLPHPYHHHRGISGDLLKKLDAVEVCNGRVGTDYSLKAIRDFRDPYTLAQMGNSDAHLPWEIGRVYNISHMDRIDEESVRACIKDRKCNPFVVRSGRSALAVYISKIVKRLRRLI